ncbi:hypothetical protein NEE10_10715 [Glaesserella parasuis]|nr:hypothetical protein NEE10_10715 [Glaesserella parasuis]
MNKIFRVIWSHAQQAWVVVSELVKSHTKTSAYTDKRAQVCTSDYFLDKQQDKFKLSLLSLILLGIFFSSVGSAAYLEYGARAVNGGSRGSIGIGIGSQVGYASIGIGDNANARGEVAVAIGYGAQSINNDATAVGRASQAGYRSAAYGFDAKAQGEGSVAIGNQATVNGNARAIAIGQQSKAEGINTVAIGYKAKAGFQRSVVIGDEATWVTVENKRTSATENGRGQDSVIVGASAKAAKNSTALGSRAEAKAFSATALGSLAKAKGESSIAIGGETVTIVQL